MKTPEFQQDIRGTADCTNRIMKDTKGCGQLSSNASFFSDSWFSGLKTAEEVNSEGVYYFGPAKTSHKGFFLGTLENQ